MFLTIARDSAVCRQMVDFSDMRQSSVLNFYSDASANPDLGVGAIYDTHWSYAKWETGFIQTCKPSIEYLELYGVAAALLTWSKLLQNRRVTIFCDNMAVVNMVNNCASSCKNCMFLLRLIMMDNLVRNHSVYASYVKSAKNDLADSLSRLQFQRFWNLAPVNMDRYPTKIAEEIWPISAIWKNV